MAEKDTIRIQSATSGLFSGMKPLNNLTPQPETVSNEVMPEPEKKREPKKGRPVSVWVDQGTAAEWKAYATATGSSVSELVCLATAEYMRVHELTEKQKTVYDALLD